jgi:diaminopimelate epimerase
MRIPFLKYHGAGNDFIVFDDKFFGKRLREMPKLIQNLCHRQLGIGADGLITIENLSPGFYMHYFNSDGNISSLCGNGSRCAVAVAHKFGWFNKEGSFKAYDGWHEAKIEESLGQVSVKMKDVEDILFVKQDFFLDTGSPHYVCFVNNLKDWDVVGEGRKIRYSSQYKEKGVNVNFVKPSQEGLKVCTYERGVENETLSCGTGVTAAALAFAKRENLMGHSEVQVSTKGGSLAVFFEFDGLRFSNIWLKGPVQFVYEGYILTDTFIEL